MNAPQETRARSSGTADAATIRGLGRALRPASHCKTRPSRLEVCLARSGRPLDVGWRLGLNFYWTSVHIVDHNSIMGSNLDFGSPLGVAEASVIMEAISRCSRNSIDGCTLRTYSSVTATTGRGLSSSRKLRPASCVAIHGCDPPNHRDVYDRP